MKFRKINVRMMATILPVVLIACAVLTIIGVVYSKKITNDMVDNLMDVQLTAAEEEVEANINSIKAAAGTLGYSVGYSYTTTSLENYEVMLGDIISSNETALGAGLWFEPYAYNAEEMYVGPYIYKDGDSLVTTYDYSNADYDYFNQEYYLNAVNASGPVVTDPYYDETSGMIMSSCSSPILSNGKFLGCVTVDMELTTITNIINSIKVGETGSALLLSNTGIYLAGAPEEKVANGMNILDDEMESMVALGTEVLANESGKTSFDYAGTQYQAEYATIPELGWKIIVAIPEKELYAQTNKLRSMMIGICVLAILFSTLIITRQVSYISKAVKQVQAFAGNLAAGDFTIEALAVKSEDELGVMGSSLNEMFESNHEIIAGISKHALNLTDAAEIMSLSANRLKEQFEQIESDISEINSAMMNSSAATEEVNASVEEVNASVNILASQTDSSKEMAADIEKRADTIRRESQEAFESANNLTKQFNEKLEIAIENAKVVESIGTMAATISNIAEEINLLALNASIEAARAGEAGRGFAVVATEIGNLATDTAAAVGKIQDTIADVQGAFDNLTEDSKGMLSFVTDTVAPDYEKFVTVANQYGDDARSFATTSDELQAMAENIRSIMQEVTDAIQSIAESAQSTADISGSIMDAVGNVSDEVTNVSDMSDQQNEIASELNTVVGKFKLD